MARPGKAHKKQALVPKFAHAELQIYLDKLNEGRKPKITAPDMLGALMLAVQRLPHEVALSLLPTYEAREQAELARSSSEEPK
jgi:hypothetical protein